MRYGIVQHIMIQYSALRRNIRSINSVKILERNIIYITIRPDVAWNSLYITEYSRQ